MKASLLLAILAGVLTLLPSCGDETDTDPICVCAGEVKPACIGECEGTGTAKGALSISPSAVYFISDDNAPATAATCNAGSNGQWQNGTCPCGYDYTNAGAQLCNEPGATMIMRFPPIACAAASARLSFTEEVSAYYNAVGITATVRRVLRDVTNPTMGVAGLCTPSSMASWFRYGAAPWTLPGGKGDDTDRTVLAGPHVDANGATLPDAIAKHDAPLVVIYDVTDLVNGCAAGVDCVLARYLTTGVHARVYSNTVSLNVTCGPSDPCGNGAIVSPEVCDDGNTTAGDGCSATCAAEAGYTCTGAPSVCVTTCGDGIEAGTEECDDGAANGTNAPCDDECNAHTCSMVCE